MSMCISSTFPWTFAAPIRYCWMLMVFPVPSHWRSQCSFRWSHHSSGDTHYHLWLPPWEHACHWIRECQASMYCGQSRSLELWFPRKTASDLKDTAYSINTTVPVIYRTCATYIKFLDDIHPLHPLLRLGQEEIIVDHASLKSKSVRNKLSVCMDQISYEANRIVYIPSGRAKQTYCYTVHREWKHRTFFW